MLSPSFEHHQCSCSSPLVLLHTGAASVELLRSYQQRFAELRPLALVLKQLLGHQNLNNTYVGGVSSYCLVLMIVAFLLHFERPREQSQSPGKEAEPHAKESSDIKAKPHTNESPDTEAKPHPKESPLATDTCV